MPKYVVSSTLKDPEWTNSTVLSGDLAAEVGRLKEEVDGDIVVHGSAQLAQALVEQGLVDELRLMVFPVVLGSGKRLFGETSDKSRYGSRTRGRSATASRSWSTSPRPRAKSVIASVRSSGTSVIGTCPAPLR